jgi:predicted PurR-regulated permease PerM
MPDQSLSLTQYVQRVLVTLVIVGLALLLWQWLDVLLLIFGAVLFAVILRAVADPISRYTKMKPGLALAVAGLLVFGIIGGTLWLFGSTIADQIGQLSHALPAAWENIKPRVAQLPFGSQIVATVEGFNTSGGGNGGAAGGAGPSPLSEGVIAQLRAGLVRLGGFARTAVGGVANIFVVLVAGAYFAAQPALYRDGVLMLLPKSARPEVLAAFEDAGRALRLWLLGTLFSMLVVGVLTGVGAAVLGLPAPIALGLIAGLAQFVPIVGPISSIVPGVLVALSLGVGTVVWTLVVYIAIQQFESNLLTPLVQRKTVSIPPALTLFAVIAMALIFGPLGVVFATPLTVVAFVMIRRLYVKDVLGEQIEPTAAHK